MFSRKSFTVATSSLCNRREVDETRAYESTPDPSIEKDNAKEAAATKSFFESIICPSRFSKNLPMMSSFGEEEDISVEVWEWLGDNATGRLRYFLLCENRGGRGGRGRDLRGEQRLKPRHGELWILIIAMSEE